MELADKGTILYWGGFALPDKNAAAHRVVANAKMLRDLGYQVVLAGITKERPSNTSTVIKTNYFGFESWLYPYPQTKKEWFHRTVSLKEIQTLVRQYPNTKAIILYNYGSIALQRAQKYCRQNGLKLISDCTEWFFPRSCLKRIDSFYRMRFVQKKLDGLILVSDFLNRYYINHKQKIVLPPLVDIQDKKWNVEPLNYDPNDVHFAYCGEILKANYAGKAKSKDKINNLIEVFNELGENCPFQFRILGITKQDYLANFPDQELTLKRLKHRIHFFGRVSHQTSIETIKSSDYFIFFRKKTLSNQAGFPTKFVEATTVNTPIITNKTSNIELFFQKENGFLLHSCSIDEIRQTLVQIMIRPKRIKFTEINSTFDYRNYINQGRLFFNQLLES